MNINISWKTLGSPENPGEYFVVNLGVVKITQKDIDDSKSVPMASCPDLSIDLIHMSPTEGGKGNGHYEVLCFGSETCIKDSVGLPYLKGLLQGTK